MNGIEVNRSNGISRLWWVALAAVLFVLLVGGPQTRSFAQDDPAFGANPSSMPGPVAERPIERPRQTFLGWMIYSSGIFGFLIMLVSLVMVTLIMAIGLELRRDNYLPTSFIDQFEQRIQSKDYQGAFEVAKESDSFIGRVLTAGMGRISRGYEEAEASMQEAGEDESMAMEHKIGYLALIASIAPLLGLLGTVQGMVMSFQAIASAPTTPKPSDLFDGIATSLFTTLEGLVVAIPAIVFYSMYKNRLARFLMESGFVVSRLMKSFQNRSKLAA